MVSKVPATRLVAPVGRRSCLSVPGNDGRKIAKASTVCADEIVFDLEDAVPVSAKADARTALCAALTRPADRWSGRVAVRVNATRTAWGHLDVQACAGLIDLPNSIVLPKVESAGDLEFLDRLLDGAEAAAGRATRIGVQALIETAAGLARVGQIAAASPRLEAVILGYADLAASLGRTAAEARVLDRWLPAQESVLLAARAHGLQAIDGPYLGVADDEPFRHAAQRARDLGFDGKWAIHPAQVDALNEIFTPSPAEVHQARTVLEALATSGAGVVTVAGQMVDEAVAVAARRVLARADGVGPR